MEHQSAVLLRRLNPYCARALEGAASLCQARAHAEILPEHWVLKLLEQGEGDLTVLARRYEWDMDALWQDLLAFLDPLPRAVRGRPQLSAGVELLLKQAWLCASVEGSEQIRSAHLLAAMIETPKLLACDGLWPLLTVGSRQLERTLFQTKNNHLSRLQSVLRGALQKKDLNQPPCALRVTATGGSMPEGSR
ncbi:ClpB protein [Cronobacter dublinensis 582]|nr:ClpB protein [Cronobacter dublinensis 582]